MKVGNAPVFMTIVGIIAFFLACLFLEIFEYSCKAILHCFLLDQEGGGSPKTPESLQEFFDSSEKYDNGAVSKNQVDTDAADADFGKSASQTNDQKTNQMA